MSFVAAAAFSWRPVAAEAREFTIQVFVVPLEPQLEQAAGLMSIQLRPLLAGNPRLKQLNMDEALSAPAPGWARTAQQKAGQMLRAAEAAMGEMDLERAESQARQARQWFENMKGYLSPAAGYTRCIALLAAALAMQGEAEEAKKVMFDLAIADPDFQIKRLGVPAFVAKLFESTKAELRHSPRGSLTVVSSPPGASIYLDGRLRGVTPQEMTGLPAGHHPLVLKMPGHEKWGKVVKIEAGEIAHVKANLVARGGGKGYLELVKKAARAVGDPSRIGEVLPLGQSLGLDLAWLCRLKPVRSNNLLDCHMFEFSHAKIVYSDAVELEAHGFNIEQQVREFGRKFLRNAMEQLHIMLEEGDPLDAKTGTEDWFKDENSSQRRLRDERTRIEYKKQQKEKTGDPLDDYDPTEDW